MLERPVPFTSGSVYRPDGHLPLNTASIIDRSESEQNPNQKPFPPELFTGDIFTVCAWGVLTCSILKEKSYIQ